jgi:NitT/TauT family transport system permease protein
MVFAGLLILAVLGVALYALSSLVENRMTGWARRGTDLGMTS